MKEMRANEMWWMYNHEDEGPIEMTGEDAYQMFDWEDLDGRRVPLQPCFWGCPAEFRPEIVRTLLEQGNVLTVWEMTWTFGVSDPTMKKAFDKALTLNPDLVKVGPRYGLRSKLVTEAD